MAGSDTHKGWWMENYSGFRNGEAKELEGKRCEKFYSPGKKTRHKNDSEPLSHIWKKLRSKENEEDRSS